MDNIPENIHASNWTGRNIYVYAYTYVHAVTISEKEDHECKEVQGGYTVCLERGKGKENCFIYHLKNKLPKESLLNLVNCRGKPI